MATFRNVRDVRKFIKCTEGLPVTIIVDPRDPNIKMLLFAGFGKPRLVDNKLSLTRTGEKYMYIRDAVIPPMRGETIQFSPRLVKTLFNLRRSTVEWGGMFVLVGGQMELSSQKRGSEESVNLGMVLSKFMYHNHPHHEMIPYSVYSASDMVVYMRDTFRYGSTRKDYLVTTSGLMSVQVSQELVKLYGKHRDLCVQMVGKVHQHIIDKTIYIQSPQEVRYVSLYEAIDRINNLDGVTAIEYIIENGLFSPEDLNKLGNVINDFINVKRFYWINYKEWKSINETGFTDILIDI